MSTNAEIVNDR